VVPPQSWRGNGKSQCGPFDTASLFAAKPHVKKFIETALGVLRSGNFRKLLYGKLAEAGQNFALFPSKFPDIVLVVQSTAVLIMADGKPAHHVDRVARPKFARPCYKWVDERCMNSTDLAAVLCNSVQRVIRSAPSLAGRNNHVRS